MKRSKHTLSHYRLHTARMGDLFPIACVPVLPGDTFQHRTSALIRVSPLNTPVMHPVSVRIHHFFVPNRIVWPVTENGGWEQFITGGPDGANAEVIPTVAHDGDKKSVLSYLGVPPIAGLNVNALPLRAFNKIFNEYYRDQDIAPLRTETTNQTLPQISWEKDYFTTARPFSQKGPTVTLPIGEKAPVKTDAADPNAALTLETALAGLRRMDIVNTKLSYDATAGGAETDRLYADLSSVSGADINTFRAAFAVQRYQEARARYGSRFTEYLRYLGITPSDARLQRPEYLGGGTSRLQFSEVLQTTPTETPNQPGVGDLYGHGIAGASTPAYRKFFEEHGYVITLASIRPKAIYQNGVPREFLKQAKEDYFQRELANLGQQEVYKAELFGENARTTFGFQDRYHEYRSHPSWLGQDFRDLLNSWHLARELDATVTLNNDFLKCVPSQRIFQVQGFDTMWVMANHNLVARRMVPRVAKPRIL